MSVREICLTLLLAVVPIGFFSSPVFAHCQVPCGIYGDERVFDELGEHATTIHKAMTQIDALAKDPKTNVNQLTRWVVNKEAHAQEIQQIALDYFLAQRVNLDEAGTATYGKQLALLHQVIVHAMKCKQTTDLAHVESLRKSLAAFKALYFKKKD